MLWKILAGWCIVSVFMALTIWPMIARRMKGLDKDS